MKFFVSFSLHVSDYIAMLVPYEVSVGVKAIEINRPRFGFENIGSVEALIWSWQTFSSELSIDFHAYA